MAAVVPVPDDCSLSIKKCETGYRIMRGRGANLPFVFVRNGEVTNLLDLLHDLHEGTTND